MYKNVQQKSNSISIAIYTLYILFVTLLELVENCFCRLQVYSKNLLKYIKKDMELNYKAPCPHEGFQIWKSCVIAYL
jgi:hypothetical protein